MPIKNRPVIVIIVAVLFLLAGGVGFAYHVTEFSQPNINRTELIWVLIVRMLAIVCGALLLMGINWSRWLAIAWLLYHVVISTLHSVSETIMHAILLIMVSVLLFHPVSSAYFRRKKKLSDNPAVH